MVIIGLVVILALAILLIVYSTHWVQYSYTQVGDPAKKNCTVVQISDLHGQTHFINGALSKMVNNVNPDMVMITGDLASSMEQLERVLRDIRKIKCDHLFFVPGNHERYASDENEYNAMLRNISESNITVLTNLGSPVDVGNQKWLLYGFDNSIKGMERLTLQPDALPNYDKVIVLAHSPSIIQSELLHRLPYDLLLVGHTHGGQIRLLGRTIGAFKDYHIGLKRVDQRRHFYINRGLGTSRIPIRVACTPEIAVFKISVG